MHTVTPAAVFHIKFCGNKWSIYRHCTPIFSKVFERLRFEKWRIPKFITIISSCNPSVIYMSNVWSFEIIVWTTFRLWVEIHLTTSAQALWIKVTTRSNPRWRPKVLRWCALLNNVFKSIYFVIFTLGFVHFMDNQHHHPRGQKERKTWCKLFKGSPCSKSEKFTSHSQEVSIWQQSCGKVQAVVLVRKARLRVIALEVVG